MDYAAPRTAATTARWKAYAGTVALCAMVTLAASVLERWLDLANIVMLFLLVVVLVALWFGSRPAVVAAFLSVGLFDFFFVPPRFSFAVNDAQYLVTFAVMLIVALTIGRLMAVLRQRANDAERHAREQSGLRELAHNLAGAMTVEHVLQTTTDFVRRHTRASATLWLPDAAGELRPAATESGERRAAPTEPERAAARAVYDNRMEVDSPALASNGAEQMMLPLLGATRTRGVLALTASPRHSAPLAEHDTLLRSVAALVSTAIERLHYVEVAGQSALDAERERLRSSLLAALSHDVRTPLTSLYGLADTLASDPALAATPAQSVAIDLRDQALQVNGMVTNLLDMARMQAGHIKLNRVWQPLDDVIGASLRLLQPALADRAVSVELQPDLPLVNIDDVLIERVLCNLLENAAKYSPAGSAIALTARATATDVDVSVSNAGPGFPPDGLTRVFELFERGAHESQIGGMGVGLAICRSLVQAHGGRIRAENPPGGARVTFSLPRGTPPEFALDSGDGAPGGTRT